MHTSPLPAPAPADGRRAGATWVAATGAFLLLASAAVFIAVRWDQLPEAAKLALVGALTGAFLAGGRAIRRSLPATGDVLFHLGAFLLPVDVAGLNLRLGLGWRALLLAEGLVGAAALGALAATAGSVVLGWAAGASVVVLAAGVAAVSPVPAPLALALAAAGAHLLGRRRPAIAWAAVAGLAPVLGAAATAVLGLAGTDVGAGVLTDLGLAGRPAALLAVVSSALAAVVLGREAARRHDLALVALAGACLVTGAATTWVGAEVARDVNFLAAPALFLVLQVVAMLCERDAFWRRPARAVAIGGEAVAAVAATPLAALFLLVAPLVERGIDFFSDAPAWTPQPLAGVAWGLLACGWLLAGWRRQSPQPSPLAALRAAVADDRTVLFLAAAAGAALVVGTASTIAIAGGLVVLAALLVASGGRLATLVAAAAAVWVPVVVGPGHPLACLPLGLAAATVLGLAAVRWRDAWRGVPTLGLAATAGLVVLGSCAFATESLGRPAAMIVAVFAAWALAALVEAGAATTGRPQAMAGQVLRAFMLLAIAGAIGGPPADILPVALAATVLYAVDAARKDEPWTGIGAALGLQAVVATGAGAAGLDVASTGLALCVGAVVAGGLAALTSDRWRLPFLAAAVGGLAAGLPLTSGDGARFAEALLLTGGLAIGAGLVTRNGIIGHAGGVVATFGLVMHLSVDDVTASELFAAPVALQLLAAGWQLRKRDDRPSSWVAYGPAVALLGAAALAERVAGGDAWHALVAGAVGVTAVAVGGWRRLAGPLFLGTGLVVAVTVLESLATLAGVPTWAWLAAGGTALLATGVALERSATSPTEAGRRLVDVVSDRFD